MDDYSQMIFGDLGDLKLPDICLTGEEKSRKNLTRESCPDRGSNPGPLRDRCACYHLVHSGGLFGRGEPGCFHSFYWRFRFGSYERAQVSSIVTIRPKKSPRSLWHRSNMACSQRCHCYTSKTSWGI